MKKLFPITVIVLIAMTGCSLFPDFNKKSPLICGCLTPPKPFSIQYFDLKGQNLLSTNTPNHYLKDSVYLFRLDSAQQVVIADSSQNQIYIWPTGGLFEIRNFGYNMKTPYVEAFPLFVHLNALDTDTIQLQFDLSFSRTVPTKIYYNGVLQNYTEDGGPFTTVIKNY